MPRHGSDRAARIVQGILSCYDRLSRFETLEPTSELNDVFEELVGLCSRVLDADTAAEVSEVVSRLPIRCLMSFPDPTSPPSRKGHSTFAATMQPGRVQTRSLLGPKDSRLPKFRKR